MHRGRQKPSLCNRPPFDDESDADAACSLIASCGQPLDPWQRTGVGLVLARAGDGLAASEVGLLVARQNGKGGILEAVAIFSLFEPMLTGRLAGRQNTVLWTAHELKTSDEAYMRVVGLIKSNDDLAEQVVAWNEGLTGQHIIRLRDGSRLIFIARSKSSGRGFSPRRIIFDEAQEFSVFKHRALMFSTSAQGRHRQLIYTGTVPNDENDSAIWTGLRDRGRKGDSLHLAWAEWTPDGSWDPAIAATIDPTDWTVRAWANPALEIADDHGITAATIDQEWEAAQADLEGFLQERLSVWPSAEIGSGLIDLASWDAAAAPLEHVSSIVLAVEVTSDRKWSTLVAVGTREDGTPQVEIVPAKPGEPGAPASGTSWVARRVAQIAAANLDVAMIVVDSKGAASSLAPTIRQELSAAGVDLEIAEVDGPHFVDSCGLTWDAIVESRLAHDDDPTLRIAIASAVKRERDGVWVWDRRRMGMPGSPLIATTLALGVWMATEPSYDVSLSLG